MNRYILIFFVLSLTPCFGQIATTYFEKVEEFNGVFVSSINQDSKGFIWLGSQDGLIRYDGHDFYNLRYTPENTNTLPGNWVKTHRIVEDDKAVF